jgi:hypothetical protein
MDPSVLMMSAKMVHSAKNHPAQKQERAFRFPKPVPQSLDQFVVVMDKTIQTSAMHVRLV